jgi:hypothetical protein
MQKIRGAKPIGVILYMYGDYNIIIYMQISQGNSLYSYLYLKQAKISCFSFYLFSFFFYKIGEQDGKTCPAQEEGLAPVGGRRDWGKEVAG